MTKTASGTETAVHSNKTAIQALSLPLQAISQAFPLLQQQNESTAITVRAAHDETHDLRQDARGFQEKVLQELTNLANRSYSSSSSLEMTIARALDRHSAKMNQLQRDLQRTHSQETDGVIAKLEAIVGNTVSVTALS